MWKNVNRYQAIMNYNRINYLVVSEKPHESNYVFKYTIQTLKERVIKSEFLTKTLTIVTDVLGDKKSIVIRFCSDYEYETKHLYALPGTKDLDGRWFEGKLDEYKAKSEKNSKVREVREMRENLFRGKRVNDDKWTEGYFYKIWDKTFILWGMTNDSPNMEEVIPETIGQYTGLTDKNGKKIFEGDIISAIALDTGTEQRAVVGFGNFIDENNGDEYIGFYIEFDGIKTTITQLSIEECKNRIEVIGNIHDNPELLEEE